MRPYIGDFITSSESTSSFACDSECCAWLALAKLPKIEPPKVSLFEFGGTRWRASCELRKALQLHHSQLPDAQWSMQMWAVLRLPSDCLAPAARRHWQLVPAHWSVLFGSPLLFSAFSRGALHTGRGCTCPGEARGSVKMDTANLV
jgi:hypothetical protein